jgi:serine-type D-Ala-D-Ala carboxypeptidase (penicillin-binding protein 5/6)
VSTEHDPIRPRGRGRSRRRRGRVVAIIIASAVLGGTGAYVPSALAAPLEQAVPEVRSISVSPASTPSIPWPTGDLGAIGLADGTGLLSGHRQDELHVMASLTKMIANLVVLDAHPLGAGESGPIITTTQRDVEHWRYWVADNASVEPVRPGLQLSQHQLMQLSLIPSAANYTSTLVDWAFGSQEAYLDAARAWLVEQGLTTVTIADATGLSPQNTGTASDLVQLARLAVAQPVIVEITGTRSVDIPGVGTIRNTNTVLGQGGVTGLKTGYTVEADYNLLFSATVDVGGTPVDLVGVLLGGPSRGSNGEDVLRVVERTSQNLHLVTAVEAGDALGAYASAWGAETTAVAADDVEVMVYGDAVITVEIALDPVATAEEGERVGTVTVTAPDGTPTTVDAVTAVALEGPDAMWRIGNPGAVVKSITG